MDKTGSIDRPSGKEQQTTNPRMSVVYLLESGRPQLHGGPYPQAEAREIRDDMRMHIENDNHQMWNIPENTARVVAITDDVLWEVEKRFHKRVAATDGGEPGGRRRTVRYSIPPSDRDTKADEMFRADRQPNRKCVRDCRPVGRRCPIGRSTNRVRRDWTKDSRGDRRLVGNPLRARGDDGWGVCRANRCKDSHYP